MERSARNIATGCRLTEGIAAGMRRKIRVRKRGKERLHFNPIY